MRCVRVVKIIYVDLSGSRLPSLCGRLRRKLLILTAHSFGIYDFNQYMRFCKNLYPVSSARNDEINHPQNQLSVATDQARSYEVEDAVLAITCNLLYSKFLFEAVEQTRTFCELCFGLSKHFYSLLELQCDRNRERFPGLFLTGLYRCAECIHLRPFSSA